MLPEEAWLRLARECPRRILAALHRSGAYRPGTTARFPGKVLCCHRDEEVPPGWAPTPAQQQAAQAAPSVSPPAPPHGDAVPAQAAPLTDVTPAAAAVGLPAVGRTTAPAARLAAAPGQPSPTSPVSQDGPAVGRPARPRVRPEGR